MYRFAGIRTIAVLVFLLTAASSRSLAAQDLPRLQEAGSLSSVVAVEGTYSLSIPVAPVVSAQPALLTQVRERRPSAMLPLYLSYATLQVLDAHSTRRALNRGAVEANPMMRGVAGNTAGMLAVKAAGTAGVIYAGEKLWKKNKVTAVIFMAATNSAMTWVVQHNYRMTR